MGVVLVAPTSPPTCEIAGSPVAFARLPDGMIEAIAVGHARAQRHHHGGGVGSISQPVNLFSRLSGIRWRHQNGVDDTLVAPEPMLNRPIVERAAQRGRPIRIGQPRVAVEGRRTGEQRDINVPAVQVLLLQKFQLEIEIPRIAAGEFPLDEIVLREASFQIRANAPNGDVGIRAEVQPLVQQVFLIEPRQVGQQLARISKVVMHIAIDNRNAILGLGSPARRGDWRGLLLDS